MSHRTLHAVFACVALVRPAPAPAAASTPRHATSQNWAGYAVTSSTSSFRRVLGAWTQPAVDCTTAPQRTYSAFWVGLGGFKKTSRALAQTGTLASCDAHGKAHYRSWYELVPAPPISVAMTINPGDTIAASVTLYGHLVTLHLRDRTTGKHFAKTTRVKNPDGSSAEWIAEAPSLCDSAGHCPTLPLADFANVTFSSALATTPDRDEGTISDPRFHATALTLDSSGPALGVAGHPIESAGPGGAKATPGALSADGSSFAVTSTRPASDTPAPARADYPSRDRHPRPQETSR
jgi:Peptidase A4 family